MSRKPALSLLTGLVLMLAGACGSTVGAVAIGGGGAAGGSGPIAPRVVSTTGGSAPEVTGDQNTPDVTSTDETSTDATSTDQTSTDQTTGGGAIGSDGCNAMTSFVEAYTKMLSKVQQGELTQSDVDAVFTDTMQASMPTGSDADYEKLHTFSNKLVGKSIAQLGDLLGELQDATTTLQNMLKSACGVG